MNTPSPLDGTNHDIWASFTSDPTTGVTLLTPDGVILYINDQSTRIFFNEPRDPDSLVGKSIRDIGFPLEWAEERIALMTEIAETSQRRLLRTVWNGKQQFSWFSPVHAEEDGEQDRILVITRRVPSTKESQYLMADETDVVRSGVICLGELSVLTTRELEILALLGQGMSIKEIAGVLFRSVKTVENHREAIGRKLKLTRGVELAGIAQSAGLMSEDSKRLRMDKVKNGRADDPASV